MHPPVTKPKKIKNKKISSPLPKHDRQKIPKLKKLPKIVEMKCKEGYIETTAP
jgi:hypothetical protein